MLTVERPSSLAYWAFLSAMGSYWADQGAHVDLWQDSPGSKYMPDGYT